MKRSDMTKQMAGYWLGLFPKEYLELHQMDEEIFNEVEEKMGALLAFLEHTGMKPPVEDVCPVLFTSKFVWDKE